MGVHEVFDPIGPIPHTELAKSTQMDIGQIWVARAERENASTWYDQIHKHPTMNTCIRDYTYKSKSNFVKSWIEGVELYNGTHLLKVKAAQNISPHLEWDVPKFTTVGVGSIVKLRGLLVTI